MKNSNYKVMNSKPDGISNYSGDHRFGLGIAAVGAALGLYAFASSADNNNSQVVSKTPAATSESSTLYNSRNVVENNRREIVNDTFPIYNLGEPRPYSVCQIPEVDYNTSGNDTMGDRLKRCLESKLGGKTGEIAIKGVSPVFEVTNGNIEVREDESNDFVRLVDYHFKNNSTDYSTVTYLPKTQGDDSIIVSEAQGGIPLGTDSTSSTQEYSQVQTTPQEITTPIQTSTSLEDHLGEHLLDYYTNISPNCGGNNLKLSLMENGAKYKTWFFGDEKTMDYSTLSDKLGVAIEQAEVGEYEPLNSQVVLYDSLKDGVISDDEVTLLSQVHQGGWNCPDTQSDSKPDDGDNGGGNGGGSSFGNGSTSGNDGEGF